LGFKKKVKTRGTYGKFLNRPLFRMHSADPRILLLEAARRTAAFASRVKLQDCRFGEIREIPVESTFGQQNPEGSEDYGTSL